MHRSRWFIVLACVLACSTVLMAQGGQTYTCSPGGYSIYVPVGASGYLTQTRTLQTSIGPVTDNVAVAAVRTRLVYAVEYIEFPAGKIKSASSARILQAMAEASTRSGHGRIISQAPFTYQGYDGLSYSFDGSAERGTQVLGQANIMLVNDRVYIISAAAVSRDDLLSPETRRFFSSFALL